MITIRDDSIVWDAKDIRSVSHALWMVADIYRDPATKEQATTADAVRLLRRWEAIATNLDKLRHGLEGLRRQQVQPRIKLTTEDA